MQVNPLKDAAQDDRVVAPTLPPGYFFRVHTLKRAVHSPYNTETCILFVAVDLRKKHLFFSTLVARDLYRANNVTTDRISSMMNSLKVALEDTLNKENRMQLLLRKIAVYSGDYPPKRFINEQGEL
jgi:hypothetical protein